MPYHKGQRKPVDNIVTMLRRNRSFIFTPEWEELWQKACLLENIASTTPTMEPIIVEVPPTIDELRAFASTHSDELKNFVEAKRAQAEQSNKEMEERRRAAHEARIANAIERKEKAKL